MGDFVHKGSVVREIWGKSDTIIFIFAGAAAEFALNKAVDWLYFTGKLPSDPIGRLFSTVAYAREIVFADEVTAHKAIDKITAIHAAVESGRQQKIPDWAYRDVLFMLIHYSIAAFELLERRLSETEKAEVFDVFYRVGSRMKLVGLPATFHDWEIMREDHLKNNLQKSHYTIDLFKQYKKHLGVYRYKILLQGQMLVVPARVRDLLGFGKFSWINLVLPAYKLTRHLRLDWLVKSILLPKQYAVQISNLDVNKK